MQRVTEEGQQLSGSDEKAVETSKSLSPIFEIPSSVFHSFKEPLFFVLSSGEQSLLHGFAFIEGRGRSR